MKQTMNLIHRDNPPLDTAELREYLHETTKNIADAVPQEVLNLADNITLRDLLESDSCRCEALSLILNISRYYPFYGHLAKEETEIVNEIIELRDLIPRKAIIPAFDLIKHIRRVTFNGKVVPGPKK